MNQTHDATFNQWHACRAENHFCEDCQKWVGTIGQATAHGLHTHDGAQTCWPISAYDSPPTPVRSACPRCGWKWDGEHGQSACLNCGWPER